MGTSAYFLVRANSKIELTKLIEDVKNICIENNLYMSPISVNYQSENIIKHVSVEIALVERADLYEAPTNDVLVDVYDEPYKYQYHSFSWYDEEIEFFNIAIIDEVYNNEKITLVLSYEILKRYPELKLWIEEDWLYTFEDIKKISNKLDNQDWCYKNPIDL
jgi:hypothetical protein